MIYFGITLFVTGVFFLVYKPLIIPSKKDEKPFSIQFFRGKGGYVIKINDWLYDNKYLDGTKNGIIQDTVLTYAKVFKTEEEATEYYGYYEEQQAARGYKPL